MCDISRFNLYFWWIIQFNIIKNLHLLQHIRIEYVNIKIHFKHIVSCSMIFLKLSSWNKKKIFKEEVRQFCTLTSIYLSRCTILSGGDDGLIRVWSRKSGKLLKILEIHTYIGNEDRIILKGLIGLYNDFSLLIPLKLSLFQLLRQQ